MIFHLLTSLCHFQRVIQFLELIGLTIGFGPFCTLLCICCCCNVVLALMLTECSKLKQFNCSSSRGENVAIWKGGGLRGRLGGGRYLSGRLADS